MNQSLLFNFLVSVHLIFCLLYSISLASSFSSVVGLVYELDCFFNFKILKHFICIIIQ